MKKISLLGSTGSIGVSVLDFVKRHPDRFKVVGLAAGSNIDLLFQQISYFNPQLVSVCNEELVGQLRSIVSSSWRGEIVAGPDAAAQVASMAEADVAVSAIVGAAGLLPTLSAVRAGKRVALANKETLVVAGKLVMQEARRRQVQIIPVDSEHCAIAQALAAGRRVDVSRIILTASGGPFWYKDIKELDSVCAADAIDHPNWRMGKKISVDSATLMNKGLEVIEARWLFDINPDQIEVLVHPQSVVHSLVEFIDGSVIAQMGIADMRIPISYALSWPDRLDTGLPRLDLSRCSSLTFYPPDTQKFPALSLAFSACRAGGIMPAVLNAANEVAVDYFLANRISFPDIIVIVSQVMEKMQNSEGCDLEELLAADHEARRLAEIEILRRHKRS